MLKENNDLARALSCARSGKSKDWPTVARVLAEAVREFAFYAHNMRERDKSPEYLLIGFLYKVNCTHEYFSRIAPPDDAYDNGTLVQVYKRNSLFSPTNTLDRNASPDASERP